MTLFPTNRVFPRSNTLALYARFVKMEAEEGQASEVEEAEEEEEVDRCGWSGPDQQPPRIR